MEVFRKKKYQIYIVGGAVRDLILERNPPAGGINWDFTTNATPEEIQKLFPNSFYHNTFGTVTVTVDDTPYEVTPFRKESDYTDHRHPEKVEWAKTIEEDLSRRDFTINALALSGAEGLASKIIDPYDGKKDIENKIIKTVGNPDKRFAEDALRLMRAVRFATELGFLIDNTTLDAIKKNAALIEKISAERVRDELFKIIASVNAADGILLLKNTGLLHFILPEVDGCFTIPQISPGRHHIYDVGTHLVMALKLCPSTDTITRLATLLHDIGKAPTFKKDEKTEMITFYNHEIVGGQMVETIAHRLRLSTKERKKLITLVRYHMFTVSELQTDKAIRRFIRQVGTEYLFDILDLRIADRLGSGAKLTSWRTELFKKRLEEVQKEPFKVTDLKINGNDVMKTLNIKPGPKIGEILDNIFKEVEEGKVKNEKSDLLQLLRRFSNISKNGVAIKGDE